ncbi:MAG: preprotein translocase subunit SecE [Pseudomonadota bacterium]
MSIIKSEDKGKWINAFVMLTCILVGFICIRFFYQLGEWFDLEAKLRNFIVWAQMAGVLVGIGTFLYIRNKKEALVHLDEVYAELVKVIWPDKDSTIKVTVGILIGVSIVAAFLILVDFIVSHLLDLLYK